MDILSRVLAGIHVRSPLLAELETSEPGSIDMMEGRGLPFHYIVYGELSLEVGGRQHRLVAGDIALLPTASRHILHLNGGGFSQSIVELAVRQGKPIWLAGQDLEVPLRFELGSPPFSVRVLSGNFLIEAEETAFLLRSLPNLMKIQTEESSLKGAMDAVWQLVTMELNAVKAGFSAVAARALELTVVLALRHWLLKSDEQPNWARGISDDHIRRALQAMYSEPGRNWTLSELAEVAGQSRSAFATRFKDLMEETPFEHLRRLRIHFAASRLHHTRKSMAMIASELGYAGSYALARAFKAEMGVSGAQYRRSIRQADGKS